MKNIYKMTLKIDIGPQTLTLNSKEPNGFTKKQVLNVIEQYKNFIESEFEGEENE